MDLKRLRKPGIGLGIASLATVLGLVVSQIPLLQTLEWKVYDLQFRISADGSRANPDIVMVSVDDLSVDRMAENGFGRFPWPRDTYAVLLDFLERGKPRVVTFDILFLEEDASTGGEVSGREADQEFVEATRRLGNVVHAVEVNDTRELRPPDAAPSGYRLTDDVEEHLWVKKPFPALAAASRMLGNTFMVLDSDGPIRRVVPFVRQGKTFYPSLPLATVMVAENLRPEDIRSDAEGLFVGGTRVPLVEFQQEYVERVTVRHMLVPYIGPPYKGMASPEKERTGSARTYRSYHFWDLFVSELSLREGEAPLFDPSLFHDKIVFIGTTAAGLHDLFQTPFGGLGKMPGMQIHASVVDGILSRSFVRKAPLYASAVLLMVSTLIVGITGVFLGFWWSLLLVLGVGVSAAGLAGWVFTTGVWLPCIPTVLGLLVAEFSGVAYKYFVEDRAKRQVRSLFSRYVSPAVVKELVEDPSRARLGGQRRAMTVLFSDIRGFTTFSEGGQPEDVIRQLNEYFSHMVELLFHHHGTLDKFVGDMIMALFNAPTEDPDHPDHAVRMGLAMLDELERLNRKWRHEGKPGFDIGIGINTGDMIVGNVGSEKTLSYTVIGDNVNLGSRLESLNKQYGSHIIISEATLSMLKGTYHVRPLGNVKVKGKTQEVAIYEVCRSAEELKLKESKTAAAS